MKLIRAIFGMLIAVFCSTGALGSSVESPVTSIKVEEFEQRLDHAARSAGLHMMGELQNPTEQQIAAKLVTRIAAGISGDRTVVDSLEWVTGVDLDGANNLDQIGEMFAARSQRFAAASQAMCDYALDPTLTDIEFVEAVERTRVGLNDQVDFYFNLKTLLPAEAVVALQEREAQLAMTIVQENRDDAIGAFAREVPDIMRQSHVRDCSGTVTGGTP